MNNLHQLLLERHSIRRYTDQPLNPEDVKTIIEAGLLAPSSKSKRPWQFVIVDDRAKLEAMAKCKPIAAHPIAKCAMAVVVCADPEKSDVFIEDASIAAVFMQLQAASLGLGSCWIQVRNRYSENGEPAQNMVQGLLGIPEPLPVICILTFGYKDEERKPVDPAKLLWEKVHIDTWKDNSKPTVSE